jgi:RNA-binding protein YhbY
MKRKPKITALIMTDAEKKEHLHRLCEELGADTIQALHKAFTLTAGALYRRAKQRVDAEMQKADQYREK